MVANVVLEVSAEPQRLKGYVLEVEDSSCVLFVLAPPAAIKDCLTVRLVGDQEVKGGLLRVPLKGVCTVDSESGGPAALSAESRKVLLSTYFRDCGGTTSAAVEAVAEKPSGGPQINALLSGLSGFLQGAGRGPELDARRLMDSSQQARLFRRPLRGWLPAACQSVVPMIIPQGA